MGGSILNLPFFFATITWAVVSPGQLGSDLSILIHNDLREKASPWADSSVILLDVMPYEKAIQSCQELGETLWSVQTGFPKIQSNLNYLVYRNKYDSNQEFWIASVDGVPTTINPDGQINTASTDTFLPFLCTQSAPYSTPDSQNASSTWQVAVQSNNQHITGFRDRRSFRFLGVRYGNYTKRWTYSEVYEGNGDSASALNYPPICLQGPGGSEDCLFLNIWTPYLPRPDNPLGSDLLPVMFWLHGGEYRVGSGNDPTFDGGNLASRGDLVVVTVNYRLGTLGFLALDDGETNGNYGLGDQFTALEWVRRNIQDFGGDPDRITVFGQSSGASSGRVMLSSSRSLGKFSGVIMQSNPGGLADGTSYSKYYTIAEEMKEFGNAVLNATNCTDASSQLECLRSLPESAITSVTDIARYLVIDGDYIQEPELDLFYPNRTSIANVPLMIGMTRDDAAVALSVPSANETIHDVLARFALPTSVAPSPEFPVPVSANHSLDLFNTTVRISTDGTMRCLNEATAYAGFKKGVFSTIFMYDFNRTYQMPDYSPNPPLCDAPSTPQFPNGDPSQEYFKCHQGELYYVFGNIQRQRLPLRDQFDLPFEQYVLDSWASFAHTGNPNPDVNMLKPRGYLNTAQQVESTEAWAPFRRDDYRIRLMQWPSRMTPLNEVEQCRVLNISLNYYDQ